MSFFQELRRRNVFRVAVAYIIVAYLQPLHDDPRWRPLLEKMNLLEYWDAMPGR